MTSKQWAWLQGFVLGLIVMLGIWLGLLLFAVDSAEPSCRLSGEEMAVPMR